MLCLSALDNMLLYMIISDIIARLPPICVDEFVKAYVPVLLTPCVPFKYDIIDDGDINVSTSCNLFNLTLNPDEYGVLTP